MGTADGVLDGFRNRFVVLGKTCMQSPLSISEGNPRSPYKPHKDLVHWGPEANTDTRFVVDSTQTEEEQSTTRDSRFGRVFSVRGSTAYLRVCEVLANISKGQQLGTWNL